MNIEQGKLLERKIQPVPIAAEGRLSVLWSGQSRLPAVVAFDCRTDAPAAPADLCLADEQPVLFADPWSNGIVDAVIVDLDSAVLQGD